MAPARFAVFTELWDAPVFFFPLALFAFEVDISPGSAFEPSCDRDGA